jgi:hypothetical protein
MSPALHGRYANLSYPCLDYQSWHLKVIMIQPPDSWWLPAARGVIIVSCFLAAPLA